MESFQLSPDGTIPRKMIPLYGKELTYKERIKDKIYGIGFFAPVEGQSNVLSQWFQLKNFSIRSHLDQLTQGLIFRLRGSKELNALAIEYSEISEVQITRFADTYTAIPFTPFWILIKLGVPPRKARFFTRYGYHFADIEATIKIQDHEPMTLRWNGRHDKAVYTFFGSKYLRDKVNLEIY